VAGAVIRLISWAVTAGEHGNRPASCSNSSVWPPRPAVDLLVHATWRFGTATDVVTHDTELVPPPDRSVTVRDGRLH
jgi:hypothetical protein